MTTSEREEGAPEPAPGGRGGLRAERHLARMHVGSPVGLPVGLPAGSPLAYYWASKLRMDLTVAALSNTYPPTLPSKDHTGNTRE